MDPKYFLILGVTLIMGWYAFGTWYNVRRGDSLARWLQSGLPRLGEKATYRWLGSSVLELVIAQARSGIERAVVLVVLAPRDTPWGWLIALLRGRSDTLILRFDLDRPPRLPYELADPRKWTGRIGLDDAAQQGWERSELDRCILMAPAGHIERARSEAAGLLAEHTPFEAAIRLGLRREPPHLELHVPYPDLRRDDPDKFFDALQSLIRAVSPIT